MKTKLKKYNKHNKWIKTTAVKRLIVINHIQNKSICLHNMCV